MIIFIIAISLGILLSLFTACIILIYIQTYYSYFYSRNNRNNRNNILPIRNISSVTVKPKKEIELIPMKKYVVIQNPDQQFSIGVGV